MTMVNINSVHDIFKILPPGVPQGSILGRLLLNDLFYFINDGLILPMITQLQPSKIVLMT